MSRKKTNKIEAETGEVVQSNRPFIIRNGGIAKPLGQGLYLLGGKTHEQGGIDIDFTGDAHIFSAQPILNGNSPAELVVRGANPSITFNRQERFKDVNGINDDGSRKAKYGLNNKNMNKNKLGGSTGLIRVQANGKDRLMYVPFTGEETKANRKKAEFGDEVIIPRFETPVLNTNPSALPMSITLDPSLQRGIDTMNARDGFLTHSGLNNFKVPVITDRQIRQQTRKALKEKGIDWWSRNKKYTAPAISVLGNIGAGLTSYLINKKMLNDLDYAPTPVAKRAAKLKTNININPELTALSENLSRAIEATNANTASSRVANARNQASMLNTTLTANKLYTDKENRESALINQDRLNQQEVANANIDAYNTWRTGKTNFENTIREQQSENAVSLVDSINKGIQTSITDFEKRRQSKNNLAMLAAAHPNVTPELLKSYGFDIELPGLSRFGGKVKLNKKK